MPRSADHDQQVPCRSCGSEETLCVGPLAPGAHFGGRDLEKPVPGGNLYECYECCLQFRHPTLTKEELDAFYASGAGDFWVYEVEDRRPDWDIVQKWLRSRIGGGAILDIGCYDGSFLQRLGDGWNLFGVEMNDEAVRLSEAKGIEIIGSDATELGLPPGRFDVVVAFDLIEHVHDPRALISDMATGSRSGGFVAIGTGNTESLSWRIMRNRYRYCSLAEHLSFINRTWCERVAEHLGLELVHVATYSHAGRRSPRLVASEVAKNMLFRLFPRFFAFLRSRGFGGIDATQRSEWEMVPPVWMTARDHILAIFRVP